MKILHKELRIYAFLLFLIEIALIIILNLITALILFLIKISYNWNLSIPINSIIIIAFYMSLWYYLSHRFLKVVPSASFAFNYDDGPWIHWRSDPRTSMTINWTTKNETESRLEYGLDQNSMEILEGTPGKIHHVEIQGLSPGTKYFYRIIDFNKDNSIHHFSTAPASSTECHFAIVGDTQNGGGFGHKDWAYPAMIERMQKNVETKQLDLILNVGDFCDQGNDLNSWHVTLDASKLAANVPMHVAVGNHDTGTHYMKDPTVKKKYYDDGANFDYFFNYKYERPPDEDEITPFQGRYYSLTYGNCYFIFVDTQNTKMAEPLNAQWSFLRRKLAEVPKGCWKIVLLHRPQVRLVKGVDGKYEHHFSKFSKFLLPIFEEFEVDIVIQGHAHIYSCIEWKKSYNSKTPLSKPIWFFISGGGGNEMRKNPPISPKSDEINPEIRDDLKVYLEENSNHILYVDISGNKAILTAKYPDNSILDEKIIEKLN
jgi:Calcineurin-like phosphoesterase/Purple acid Phosphatase, N-terminal domain